MCRQEDGNGNAVKPPGHQPRRDRITAIASGRLAVRDSAGQQLSLVLPRCKFASLPTDKCTPRAPRTHSLTAGRNLQLYQLLGLYKPVVKGVQIVSAGAGRVGRHWLGPPRRARPNEPGSSGGRPVSQRRMEGMATRFLLSANSSPFRPVDSRSDTDLLPELDLRPDHLESFALIRL